MNSIVHSTSNMNTGYGSPVLNTRMMITLTRALTFAILLMLVFMSLPSEFLIAQDWKGVEVPPDLESGMIWKLQADVSDDFNVDFEATQEEATIGDKWKNYYPSNWTGPAPTFWKRDHVDVQEGVLRVHASRTPGETVAIESGGKKHTLAKTNLGCVSSTRRVVWPVYVEARVKVMNSVLASDVWLLSPDATQEIDICEAYGGGRWNNPWFSNQRLHLSHHVFIRKPFTDWQPKDAGTYYTDEKTVWNRDFHRIGVYWKDPWNLEYYVDGQLVRTVSGKDRIDPQFHTNAVNPGDKSKDTRTGLSKEMDIIINTEDQTWRATQGLTPTEQELKNKADHTFQVDWIRVYKPVRPNAHESDKATRSVSEGKSR